MLHHPRRPFFKLNVDCRHASSVEINPSDNGTKCAQCCCDTNLNENRTRWKSLALTTRATVDRSDAGELVEIFRRVGLLRKSPFGILLLKLVREASDFVPIISPDRTFMACQLPRERPLLLS